MNSWLVRVGTGLSASGFVGALMVVTVTQALAAGQPLADVNGDAITAEEVDAALRPQISKLEEQIYHLKRDRVEALIRDRLLAQEANRRGTSVHALLDAEVTTKVGLVTEQEVEQFYQANKSRITGDEAKAREQIRSGLQAQKLAMKREEFVRSLRSKANVVTYLQAPPVSRIEVGVAGAPVKGSAEAPVTIVEFSDFLCPFCRSVQPTLGEIARRYGDKVRFVFRDFPIEQLHPGARNAAQAARCAGDQGKFWPYHDVLFEKPLQGGPNDLVAYAREVGLDTATFEACLSSGKHGRDVQKDMEDGAQLGINGTPAFFVNGRSIVGAQPMETFVQVIEDELSRRK
jgi:protein-disulfide isomerase